MSRIISKVISNEDVYRSTNYLNSLSNKNCKLINLTFESVTVDEKIAQGGYGTVYKVHSFNKSYALKKLCVNNQDKLLNCIQEIFILKNVRNNYILQFIDSIIYQIDFEIYEVYILTDLCEGNLSAEMKAKFSSNKSFDECDVLMIMMNIAEAVACLHHFQPNPIIHRDLKVENILIGYPTRYVLCDFGSAIMKEVRPCEVNRQQLQDEILEFTTLAYRSPEMADLYYDGGEHVIGHKSDIWALGVLMYNICFFSLPFGDSVLSILSDQFTVPDDHIYSDNVMKAMYYCLTKNPSQRPDIYQLSSILFSISSKSNPIQNYKKSKNPNLNDLKLPLKESQYKALCNSRQEKNKNANVNNFPVVTSIRPRDRPKPGVKGNNAVSLKAEKSESIHSVISQNRNSTIQDSLPMKDNLELNTDNKITKTLSIDEFDKMKIDKSISPDLMDFESSINDKTNNSLKCQSLGKTFKGFGLDHITNIHEMISQSYQNVSHIHPNAFNNPQPNYYSQYRNHHGNYMNNPFVVNNSNVIPANYSQIYQQNFAHAAQIGHRRLISDPSCWTHIPVNSNNVPNKPSEKILQPKKIVIKSSAINVLNEFDPLTK